MIPKFKYLIESYLPNVALAQFSYEKLCVTIMSFISYFNFVEWLITYACIISDYLSLRQIVYTNMLPCQTLACQKHVK